MFCRRIKPDESFIIERPEGNIIIAIDREDTDRGRKHTIKIDDPLKSKIRMVSRKVASQEVDWNRGRHGT